MIENATGGGEKGKTGTGYQWWDVVKMIIISLVIVLPIRYYIAQPFIVRGDSMKPNFEDREYLIIDELSFLFREPRRGEVVVFRYPNDRRQFFIKRVVGLPKERVEIRSGRIYIFPPEATDDYLLEENYLVPSDRLTYPDINVTLGEDEYFVLGDNRDFSSDSRFWGPLPHQFLIGRAFLRVLPPHGFGLIR